MTDFVAIKNGESPDAFADRVIGAIQKYSIADLFVRALVRPMSVPEGSPPDPLTQKKAMTRWLRVVSPVQARTAFRPSSSTRTRWPG
jgi:hypothetical protein